VGLSGENLQKIADAAKLRDSGVLSEEEFQELKAQLLRSVEAPSSEGNSQIRAIVAMDAFETRVEASFDVTWVALQTALNAPDFKSFRPFSQRAGDSGEIIFQGSALKHNGYNLVITIHSSSGSTCLRYSVPKPRGQLISIRKFQQKLYDDIKPRLEQLLGEQI